jgi:hypothetical protein
VHLSSQFTSGRPNCYRLLSAKEACRSAASLRELAALRLLGLLPVPENLATDVSLLLFGGSAIIAIIVALLVLPETKGLPSPETIADAVVEMKTKLNDANRRAHQVAVVLGQLIAVGVSVLLGLVVAAAISGEGNRQSIIAGASTGTGSALLLCGSIGLCYWLR